MVQFLLFLHVLGAVTVGIYVLMPFMAKAAEKQIPQGRVGLLKSLRGVNRIAMYVLIVQLLTGGYLMSQGEYSAWWMALVTVLWFAVGALTGVIGSRMKKAVLAIEGGQEASMSGILVQLWINAILLVLIVVFMVYRG